jgi:hypothetical protein
MDDMVVRVKQIAQYPIKPAAELTDAFLLQQVGIGGPYAWTNAEGILRALWGTPAEFATILTGDITTIGSLVFQGAGTVTMDPMNGFRVNIGGEPMAQINGQGDLWISGGFLLNRDPVSPMEAATAQYVTDNTVWSFNDRRGPITLLPSDIVLAGGVAAEDAVLTGKPMAPTPANPDLDTGQIATTAWVQRVVKAQIGRLFHQERLVISFNGRGGHIGLMVSDIMPLLQQVGLDRPFAPTPNPADRSERIATTQWVMWQVDNLTDLVNTVQESAANPAAPSGSSAPGSPATGSLWLDTGSNTLSIWTGSTWMAVGGEGAQGPVGPMGPQGPQGIQGPPGSGATVSLTQPPTPGTGDQWFDTTDSTLSVWTGSAWASVSGSGGIDEPTVTSMINAALAGYLSLGGGQMQPFTNAAAGSPGFGIRINGQGASNPAFGAVDITAQSGSGLVVRNQSTTAYGCGILVNQAAAATTPAISIRPDSTATADLITCNGLTGGQSFRVMNNGTVLLNGDPTVALGAATKQYVDAAVGGGVGVAVPIADVPPSSVVNGDMWWDSVSGQLFIYNAPQWVIANSPVALPPPPGVTDGSDALPGQVGEYATAQGSGTGGTQRVATLNLTAGDWSVSGMVSGYGGDGGTAAATLVLTQNATTVPIWGQNYGPWQTNFTAGNPGFLNFTPIRISGAAAIALVLTANFSAGLHGTYNTIVRIDARRVR